MVLLLSLAAGWSTLHSPTIFFDNQIMLGSSLGVFALLQYGWLGLPVGVAAALGTLLLWGHPWAALVLVLQLLWQQLFLSRCNGGPEQLGNGRIVLATIAFWLLVGLPLKTLLYAGLLQVDLSSNIALGFKEAVVGVVNSGLGLVLYLSLQWHQVRRHGGDLPLRGLIFATLLMLISVPGVLIITAMGQQITIQAMAQIRLNLEQQAQAVALDIPVGSNAIPAAAHNRQHFANVNFEAVAEDRRRLSSNPGLFARLARDYRPELTSPLGSQGLTLLVPNSLRAVVQRDVQGYWLYRLTLPHGTAETWRQITVVQPARQQVELLMGMMRPSLQILGLLLITAALISELITTLLSSQFNRILGSLLTSEAAVEFGMPALQRTRLRELNRMVHLINEHAERFNALSHALQRSNQQLRLSEQQHRLLADNALDVITISDPKGRPTYISPSIEKVRGWSVAEAMALPMDQHLTAEGCTFVLGALQQTQDAIDQGLPLPTFRVELQQSHKNGSWIWTDCTSSCIIDEAGHYIGTLLVYRDISERKRLEGELLERASVDALTGLLNRGALLDQLQTLLSHPDRRRGGEMLALLFCDLDLFKEINDRLGHAAGDTVLQTVARRIHSNLRADDLAARMGGDELVVVLKGVTDLPAALAVARTIAEAIEQPITLHDQEKARITASIGVTLARPGEGVDALMARADMAMYRAKQAGGNQVIQIDAIAPPAHS